MGKVSTAGIENPPLGEPGQQEAEGNPGGFWSGRSSGHMEFVGSDADPSKSGPKQREGPTRNIKCSSSNPPRS